MRDADVIVIGAELIDLPVLAIDLPNAGAEPPAIPGRA